jgi:hypothetical protein
MRRRRSASSRSTTPRASAEGGVTASRLRERGAGRARP